MNAVKTLAERGYRHPAEWSPHAATWIVWPHNTSDWPGRFAPIPWVYGELVRKLSLHEDVHILADSERRESGARRILERNGVNLGAIHFHRFATDRGWTRDAGPIFVKRDSKKDPLAIARFRFNAWARYPNWKKDNLIPELAAKELGLPLLPVEAGGKPLVLEGGSIDVNGAGDLLTTEECLLDREVQPRNPHLSRAELENALRGALGVTNIIWLGKGVAGDDTHGHVDDLCRFVNPNTAVLVQETNSADANYMPLQENRERMQNVRLANGSKLEIVGLPMPSPLIFEGQRLPASYANFYIANNLVVMPTFNDPNDRVALGVLGELFPDRVVTGIHAVDLIWGLGAFHCLTHEQPA
ncbi:MAG: agmatine deiminase family protein [bacterium]|nr:agmatine deiminase family protein [bacterium]